MSFPLKHVPLTSMPLTTWETSRKPYADVRLKHGPTSGCCKPLLLPWKRLNTISACYSVTKRHQAACVETFVRYCVLWMTEAEINHVGCRSWASRVCRQKKKKDVDERDFFLLCWSVFVFQKPCCGLWACCYDNHHLIPVVCRKAERYGGKLANCFIHVL